MSDLRPLDADERTAVADGPAARPALTARSIAAAGIGHGIEIYEFTVFSALTPVISELFFPPEDRLAAILSTFAVFAVGFIVRPLGAIIFGRLADRHGRKLVLALSVLMMGIVTVLIGVIPTYGQVGVLAPTLLVVARVLQGLSVGVEVGTSSTYLVELAPTQRRGFYGSFVVFSSVVGSLVGIFLILVLTLGLSAEAMQSWGWRVPFLLGFPLLLGGLYLRYRSAETPAFEQLRSERARAKSPLASLLRDHWRSLLVVVGICVGFQVMNTMVQGFMLSYIRTVVGLAAVPSLVSLGLAAVVGGLLILFFGRLSDRIGRWSVLLMGCAFTVVLAFPGMIVAGLGGFLPALIGQILLWVPLAAFGGVISVTFAELFPAQVRVSGFGIAYSIGSAVFAGTTPFFATLLVQTTGNTTAPAWLMIAAGVVTAVVVLVALPRRSPDTVPA